MEKWIPWDQLAPPEALWADHDDTVAALRQRLSELEGHGPYNAPILIRLPQGKIAPTGAAISSISGTRPRLSHGKAGIGLPVR